MSGCQCPKKLWYDKHRKDLYVKPDAMTQAIFDQGRRVGLLAQNIFPGGVDVSPEFPWEYHLAAAETQQKIEEGCEIIYEATFQYKGVMAALDILVQIEGKWYGYEVKSSTSVKNAHVQDVALQYWVITGSGFELEDISLVHINNRYVKQGELNVEELFSKRSLKNSVLELQITIESKVSELKAISVLVDEPTQKIGEQCKVPYNCNYMRHCWKDVPENSVFDLYRMHLPQKMELFNEGIVDLLDVPEGKVLSKDQRLQVDSNRSGEVYVNKKGIQSFLNTLTYPLYYLDFETFSSSIPPFNGARAFQQIPFQYSMHYKEHKDAPIEHFEFLAKPEGDPRPSLIVDLIEKTSLPGDILAYNKSFEQRCLQEMATTFPEFAKELNERATRLKDLLDPFQAKHYYHPKMKGSASLKAVLPCLVPELSYQDLEIKEGGTASHTFSLMINKMFEGDEEQVKMDLLEYCKLDTLAMVRLLEKLEAL